MEFVLPKPLSRTEALQKSLLATGFYVALIVCLLWALPERAWYEKPHGFFIIGFFGIWRYSWQIVHIVRMKIYQKRCFPALRKAADALTNKYPRRLYFMIPSYFEMPLITEAVFRSIVRECLPLPCEVTLVISVGSQKEIRHIRNIVEQSGAPAKMRLMFMIQSSGKRIAMGHALRAISRDYHRLTEWDVENENDLVVFMDGDSMLCEGVLEKTLPFFRLNSKLGVLTTHNIALSIDRRGIFQKWYELKFAQRNHQFQSHSLSKRILTATGRFSIYRAPTVLDEEFIRFVEADHLEHWLFGRFRFLMGDDKSTWFYLLKQGAEMLYVPDAAIVALEGRTQQFAKTSYSLMTRWYGNMLRNNARALRLGPKKTGGLFIWWCLFDQRLTTWTPLVGLISASLMGLVYSPFYFLFYMIWVLFTRLINVWAYILQGFHFSAIHIPLLLYGQWVGCVIKLLTMYNLKQQTWGKGDKKNMVHDNQSDFFSILQRSVRYLMICFNVSTLFFICGLMTHTLSLPTVSFFKDSFSAFAQTTKSAPSGEITIDPMRFGAIPDDDLPDDAAINAAVRSASGEKPVTIQLPPGRFILNAPIIIDKNYVTLAGAGPGTTLLEARFSVSAGDAIILVKGNKGTRLGKMERGAKRGDQLFLLTTSNSTLAKQAVAGHVWLGTPNTRDFLDQIGSVKWDRQYPWLRQALVPCEEVSQGIVRLSRPLPLDLPGGSDVFVPTLTRGVTLRNLGLTQHVPDMTPAQAKGIYENIAPQYAIDGIRLDWTADVRVENVTITFAGRHPLAVENSWAAQLSRLNIDGAWNKGAGGHGYVRFARAYASRLTESHIDNIRHLAFQWSAADNVVENCHIGADVNFHGGFSHHNRVSNSQIKPPPGHLWGQVTTMPEGGGAWAPMDGPGNIVEPLAFPGVRE